MSNTSIIKGRDNVFYDTFDEVLELYPECRKDVWEASDTIVLYDTNEQTGLFDKSDIIIVYRKEDKYPAIITERIYRRNYSLWQWLHVVRILKLKTKYFEHELGFNISVTYGRGFVDYVHYKEWWWEWAQRQRL